MCGIAGVYYYQKKAPKTALKDLEIMGRCLEHRGPDDHGVWVKGPVGLAHRRLAIIDTSTAGRQPMVSKDEQTALSYNGEIYNFKELAKKHLSNTRFFSQTDTEVLLKLLQKQGPGAINTLQGMFAFAYWHAETEQLLLARDPFGMKPLYYAELEQVLVFASEPKAILAHPLIHRRLAPNETARFLLHEYVPLPASGWTGIKQLPPGFYLKVNQSGLKLQKWHRPKFQPKHQQSERQIIRQFDELLGQAVERRMVADVPVGVFLSGGIDSSTIAWYIKQCRPQALHSCSIEFTDPSYNESDYAELAAKSLDTIHSRQTFTSRDVVPALEELQSVMDIPLGDASLLPTFRVSQLARRQMKVVLSGDGADELLGGYGTFQADAVARRLAIIPPDIWPLLARLLAFWPVSHRYFSFDFKLKSFVRGMSYNPARRHQLWLGSFNQQELSYLLKPARHQELDHLFARVDEAAKLTTGLAPLDEISSLTIMTYLVDDILVKLDRASMAAGLEARAPFLDQDLAQFLLRLPVKFKRKKRILKQLMAGRLPDRIINRPKKGFGIPLNSWLAGPLYNWASEVLSRENIERDGLFEPDYVQLLLSQHRRQKADHRKKLWTLISWQMWYENWVIGDKSFITNDKSKYTPGSLPK